MKIALIGDIALFGKYSVKNNPRLPDQLQELSRYLSGFDYVIGNLEIPFSVRKKPYGAKSAFLCSDPENIDILTLLNISAVSLANNHMFDFGREGLETTIRLLDEKGIRWFGINGKDFKIEKEGNRISVNGFCCYSSNPQGLSSRLGKRGLNAIRGHEVEQLIEENHKNGWLNIISVHSGTEHVSGPSLEQIRLSRKLAEKASYVWHGHHPHVVQGIDEYRDSIIAHSLGNFLFSDFHGDRLCPPLQLTEENRTGMIVELDIEKNRIKEYGIKFIRMGEAGNISIREDDDLKERYSEILSRAHSEPENYRLERTRQREEYLRGRREMRDLKWVIRHLRPRYVRLILDYRKNRKKYHKAIRRHI